VSISVHHFTDNARDNTTVYLDAYCRTNAAYDVSVEDGKITSVSLKLSGRVAVLDSNYFYEFFAGNLLWDVSSSVRHQFGAKPLPVCVRYQSEHCIVIERPPFKVSPRIRYGRRSYRESARYATESEIWIPWSVMVLHCSTGFSSKNPRIDPYLYFRDEPLSSFDDQLIVAYTPNIFTDGRICLGNSETRLADAINKGEFSKSDINSIYFFIMNEYFMGGWNMDLGHTHNISILKEAISKMIRASSVSSLIKMAKSRKNRYLANRLQEYDELEDAFTPRTSESFVKFHINYMSLLNLDDTLSYVKLLMEKAKNAYNHVTRNSKTLKLGNVLARLDDSFENMHEKVYKNSRSWWDRYDKVNKGQQRDAELARYCISHPQNQTKLHTWSLCIEFDLEDFLDYASTRALDKYDDDYDLRKDFSRSDYVRKEISATFARQESTGQRNNISNLAFLYINKLKKYSNIDVLYNAIDLALIDLDEFYRTEKGLQQNKNAVVIKLRDLDISKKKEVSV